MVKTLQFGDRDVTFSTAFAWTFVYKSQFGDDPMAILVPVIKKVFSDPEIEKLPEDAREEAQTFALLEILGITGVAQIAWAMAKLSDSSTPAPLAWVASFGDDFPVMDLVEELITEAISSCFATKKSEAPIPAEPTKKTGAKTKK